VHCQTGKKDKTGHNENNQQKKQPRLMAQFLFQGVHQKLLGSTTTGKLNTRREKVTLISTLMNSCTQRYVINVLLSLFCHTHYNIMVDFSIPKQKTTGESFARNHQEN
jgi:hypothetical protein